MRRIISVSLFLTMIFLFCFVLTAGAYKWSAFNFENKGSGKALKLPIPKITLSAAEEEKLYSGKGITRLLDAPGGLKKGYLRFFAPFDPVTAWMVVTDAAHFDLVDTSFPSSGSLTDRRRTFMPYTFEVATCKDKGKSRMSQLLVMPLVAPRKLCIDRHHDTNGFPFESYWSKVDPICCVDKWDPKIKEKYYEKAVTLKKNIGCWHIGPLPDKFQRDENDLMRSDCVYFVDTNPGGDLGKLKSLVNKAQSTALPALMKNVVFHGKRWEKYLAKHHGQAMTARYKQWVNEYKQWMNSNK